MAARLNPRNAQAARDKIKTLQLINWLQKHALTGRRASNSRVRAACFLVNQAIGQPPAHVELEPVAPSAEADRTPEIELTDEEILRRLAAIEARRASNGHGNGVKPPGKVNGNGSSNGSTNGHG